MANFENVPALGNSMSSDILAMSSNFGLLRSAFASTVAPTNPVVGQVWYKILGSNLYERYTYNGIAWVKELGGDGIDGRMVQWSGPTSLSIGTNTDIDVADSVTKKHTQNTDTGTENDFSLTIVGKGFKIKEGTNAVMGITTLVAGTKVVSTTKVAANSRIFLSTQSGISVGFVYVSARTVGTSFTIQSLDTNDGSDVAWFILNPV